MKRTTFVGLGTALLMMSASPAALAVTDEEFLKMAIGVNLAEISAGELAQDKAASDQVKEFGEQLVEDHTKANEEAKRIASSMNVTAPTEPPAEEKQAAERLSGMSGSEFDREFLSHMVMGHEKAISLFEDKADDGNNEVSTFAEQTLPDLRKHLETAQSLSQGQGTAMMGGETGQTASPGSAGSTDRSATAVSPQAPGTATQSGQGMVSPNDQTAQTTTPMQGQPARPEGLRPADPASISADNILNTTVYGANDEMVGEIGDVILAKDGGQDGKIDAVVVDVGGFLGIGEKPVAIGFDDLQFMTDQDGDLYVYSKFTQQDFQSAPEYNQGTFEQNRDQMIMRSRS